MGFLQKQPALAGALLSLLGAVLGVFIHNPALVVALVGVAGAFLGVRSVVTPVTTAATNITQAATQAATEVTKSLDQTVVGTVGEVTGTGQAIIDSTVGRVVDGLLGKGKS
jgi:hypothetical protein